MFCDVCGSKVNDETMICVNCGNKVKVMGADTVAMFPMGTVQQQAPVSSQAPVTNGETPSVYTPQGAPVMPEANTAPASQPASNAYEPVSVGIPSNQPAPEPIANPNGPQLSKEQIVSIAEGAKNSEGAKKPAGEKKKEDGGGFVGFIKKFKFLLIGVAALLIVIAVLGANYKYIVNSVMKSGKSDTYFKWIAKNSVTENTNNMLKFYSDYADVLNLADKEVEGKIDVEIGEEAAKYIKLAKRAGYDFTWVENASASYDVVSKDNIVSVYAKGAFNGVDIVDVETILDTKNEEDYTTLPLLSSAYVMSEARGLDIFSDQLSEYEAISKAIPDKKIIKKLILRYFETAVGEVKTGNVKVSDKTIRAGGLTQEVSAVTLTVDNDLCRDIAIAVVDEMRKDKDLQKLIEQLVKDLEDTELGDEYNLDDFDYDEFLDELDELSEDLEDMDFLTTYDWRNDKMVEEEYEVIFYVNRKGEIIGEEVKYESPVYGDADSVKFVKVTKGTNVAYKLESDELTITATGKEVMNKFTGVVDIEYFAMDIAEIEVSKFDIKAAKKGMLKGKFAISLDDSITKGSSMLGMASDIVLVIDCDMTLKSGKAAVEILDGDDLIANVKVNYKSSKGSKIKIPSGKAVIDAEDSDAEDDFFETLDLKGLVKRLDKAGAPDDIIERIDEIEDVDDLEDFLYDLY